VVLRVESTTLISGGIISSGVDGIRAAMSIVQRYE
jgi:hypothetical protein